MTAATSHLKPALRPGKEGFPNREGPALNQDELGWAVIRGCSPKHPHPRHKPNLPRAVRLASGELTRPGEVCEGPEAPLR